MKVDSIQDSTRYVVSEVHKGSIIPGNRAEMWRSIYLDKGANIHGGIWGGEMQISGGNVSVSDSVYIRGAINIFNESKKKLKINEIVEFSSVVSTPESLSIENNAPRTRFNSDLYVGQLVLKNTIVYGNIYAANARLENCIVLGGIYCKKKLELTNTIVFVFKTKSLKLNQNIYMLSPYSISEEEFDIEYPVKALTFFNLLDNNSSGGTISLDENDIFKVKYNERETEDESGNSLPSNVYILSIVERILNSSSIIEQFRKNKELIEFLAFGNNLLEEFNEKFKDFTKNDLEKSLWKIVDEGVSSTDISGSDNFNELLKILKSDGVSAFKKINSVEKNSEPQTDISNGSSSGSSNAEVKNNSDQEIYNIDNEPDNIVDIKDELSDQNISDSNIIEDDTIDEQLSNSIVDGQEDIIEEKQKSLIECPNCGLFNRAPISSCTKCGEVLIAKPEKVEEDNEELIDLTDNEVESSIDKIKTDGHNTVREEGELTIPESNKTRETELEKNHEIVDLISEIHESKEIAKSDNVEIELTVTDNEDPEINDDKDVKEETIEDISQKQIITNEVDDSFIECDECGESNDIKLKFCISCGSKLQEPKTEESIIECSSCSNKYSDEFDFCPECGNKN